MRLGATRGLVAAAAGGVRVSPASNLRRKSGSSAQLPPSPPRILRCCLCMPASSASQACRSVSSPAFRSPACAGPGRQTRDPRIDGCTSAAQHQTGTACPPPASGGCHWREPGPQASRPVALPLLPAAGSRGTPTSSASASAAACVSACSYASRAWRLAKALRERWTTYAGYCSPPTSAAMNCACTTAGGGGALVQSSVSCGWQHSPKAAAMARGMRCSERTCESVWPSFRKKRRWMRPTVSQARSSRRTSGPAAGEQRQV